MSVSAVTPDTALDDLRALTLRRLAALARLATIAAAIGAMVNRWLESVSLGGQDWLRVPSALARVRRALRMIEGLDGKLRESLRLIQAGVWPPTQASASAAEVERPEQPERPEALERLDRESFPGLGARGFDALLKRPVEDIVARILDDLAIFPAWRELAQAAWDGAPVDPDETARILAAPIALLLSVNRRRTPAGPEATLTAPGLGVEDVEGPPRPRARAAPA